MTVVVIETRAGSSQYDDGKDNGTGPKQVSGVTGSMTVTDLFKGKGLLSTGGGSWGRSSTTLSTRRPTRPGSARTTSQSSRPSSTVMTVVCVRSRTTYSFWLGHRMPHVKNGEIGKNRMFCERFSSAHEKFGYRSLSQNAGVAACAPDKWESPRVRDDQSTSVP